MDLLKQHRWLAILLLLAAPQAHAADGLRLEEQQIKAGLLYNFLKYTEWPESSFAKAPSLHVCIFGDDPFGGKLDPMQGMTVNQRDIVIRRVRDAKETDHCHLLFLNAAERSRWPALREALAGKAILTVSDFKAFASNGGMIEFGHKNNHVSASLNVGATTGAGLRVEDRMLRLVTVIKGRQP